MATGSVASTLFLAPTPTLEARLHFNCRPCSSTNRFNGNTLDILNRLSTLEYEVLSSSRSSSLRQDARRRWWHSLFSARTTLESKVEKMR